MGEHIKVTLKDVFDDPGKEKELEADVYATERGITVKLDGYSDLSGGETILIELCDGEARVVIWGSNEQEDPTHIISLEDANDKKPKVKCHYGEEAEKECTPFRSDDCNYKKGCGKWEA